MSLKDNKLQEYIGNIEWWEFIESFRSSIELGWGDLGEWAIDSFFNIIGKKLLEELWDDFLIIWGVRHNFFFNMNHILINFNRL